MKTSSTAVLALLTLALVACDRPSDTRVASATPEAIKAAPNTAEPPPLPVKSDVDAAEIEAVMKTMVLSPPSQAPKGPDQALDVAAQDAAANAPDTASADEAKKRVLEGGTGAEGTNAAPRNPQAAELTKGEEVTEMPKPGQANDHSSGPRGTE